MNNQDSHCHCGTVGEQVNRYTGCASRSRETSLRFGRSSFLINSERSRSDGATPEDEFA
jgi:hypothetical protein